MCSFEISFVRSWYLRFSQNQLLHNNLLTGAIVIAILSTGVTLIFASILFTRRMLLRLLLSMLSRLLMYPVCARQLLQLLLR